MIEWLKSLFHKDLEEVPDEYEILKDKIINDSEKKTLEEDYETIVSFWNLIDLENIPIVNNRILGGIYLSVFSNNITNLINNLDTVNELISVKDYSELARFGSLVHQQFTTITLDNYLTDKEGYPLELKPTLLELKETLKRQKELFNEVDNLNRLWPINKIYLDLINLTKIVLELLPER